MPQDVVAPGSKERAEILLRAALSKKAVDPMLIRLGHLTTLTDYFLIVSARSGKHVKAVAEAIMEEARNHKIEKLSTEGVNQGTWALLDYGDVIVHVFHRPVREFYDLEGLWAEAPREEFSEELAGEILNASEIGTDDDMDDSLDW